MFEAGIILMKRQRNDFVAFKALIVLRASKDTDATKCFSEKPDVHWFQNALSGNNFRVSWFILKYPYSGLNFSSICTNRHEHLFQI